MVTFNTEREAQRALQSAQIKAALVKYAAHESWEVWTYNLPALSLKLVGPRNRFIYAMGIMGGWHVNGAEGDDLAALLDAATSAGGRTREDL